MVEERKYPRFSSIVDAVRLNAWKGEDECEQLSRSYNYGMRRLGREKQICVQSPDDGENKKGVMVRCIFHEGRISSIVEQVAAA